MTALVMDMGGVLCRDAIGPKLNDLSRRYDLPIARLRATARRLRPFVDIGRMGENEFWTSVLTDQGVRPAEEDLDLLPYAVANFGAREFLSWARTAGHSIAVLTNDSMELFRLRAAALGPDAHFTATIVSAATGMTKPNAEIYRCVAATIGVKPTDCLFVDDQAENVVGAESVGMRAVVFRTFGDIRTILTTSETGRHNSPTR